MLYGSDTNGIRFINKYSLYSLSKVNFMWYNKLLKNCY